MDFNLSSLVKTTSDVDLLNKEIDILIDSLYRTGKGSFEETINRCVRNQTAEILKTTGSTEQRKDILEQLRLELEQSSKVVLTIAFEPTKSDIERIVDWCRKNIEEKVIVEFKFDQSILAGTIIEWKGKYMDVSLAGKLERAIDESL